MFSSVNVRKTTNQIVDLVDKGILDPRQILLDCLNYMSEADVADMAFSSGLLDDLEDEEDTEIE